ncbi:MAG: hypothetical protein U1F68_12905 [Gammaproteobacteria bacterium]
MGFEVGHRVSLLEAVLENFVAQVDPQKGRKIPWCNRDDAILKDRFRKTTHAVDDDIGAGGEVKDILGELCLAAIGGRKA